MLGSFRVETIDTVDVAVVRGGGPTRTPGPTCAPPGPCSSALAAGDHRPRSTSSSGRGRRAPRCRWPPHPERCGDDLLRTSEATDRLTDSPPISTHRRERLVRTHRRRTRQRQLLIAQSPGGTMSRPLRQGPTRSVRRVRSPAVLHRELQRRDPRPRRGAGVARILETDIGTLGISISWEIFLITEPEARSATVANCSSTRPTGRVTGHDRAKPRIASSRLRAVEPADLCFKRRPPASPGHRPRR